MFFSSEEALLTARSSKLTAFSYISTLNFLTTVIFLLTTTTASAQSLGGNSIFNFLKLPNTPQLVALGGINVSQPSNDIGLVFNNPALLKPVMHSQMNAVFNDFYSNIKTYHVSLGYHHK